jgi:hypothetical protein
MLHEVSKQPKLEGSQVYGPAAMRDSVADRVKCDAPQLQPSTFQGLIVMVKELFKAGWKIDCRGEVSGWRQALIGQNDKWYAMRSSVA